ncbi:LOW QUALITY PROTEIN: hypothetical protein U9M48_028084 [Paspalum notatum var. saurae]|uniref:Tf2-1-like SH3-like domain-containing protein n=1 Tax=Paspalum notatum var. saurae TaxID=547442 RepID=A0AAQ3TVU3_PASNO
MGSPRASTTVPQGSTIAAIMRLFSLLWVWLHLLDQPAASLDVRGRSKLGPWIYGSLKVLARIGEMAYRLQLPASRPTPAFTMSFMWVCSNSTRDQNHHRTPPLPPMHHGRACPFPRVSSVVAWHVPSLRSSFIGRVYRQPMPFGCHLQSSSAFIPHFSSRTSGLSR